MKKARYHEMLRSNIQKFVSRSNWKTLEDMIARAREKEIDLEMEKKRNPNLVISVVSSGKRPKVVDTRGKGHQGRSHCGKYGRSHEGACRVGGSGCFMCGRTGQITRDCTTATTTTPISYLICFN